METGGLELSDLLQLTFQRVAKVVIRGVETINHCLLTRRYPLGFFNNYLQNLVL